MALAATDFSSFSKFPLGNGRYQFWVKYTGPASYAAPEVLTQAIARSAFQGISYVDAMIPTPAFNGSGGSVEVQFEPSNSAGTVGSIRFMNATHAHTHDIKVIGGQAASTTNDIANYANTLGKQEATNATIAGATSSTLGGVVNAAANAAATEVTSTTNLSTYSCWFTGIGVA